MKGSMANGTFNQYEVNQKGSKAAQNVLRQGTVLLYDAIKGIFGFINMMIRQFLGK